jgi:hypothetical protein
MTVRQETERHPRSSRGSPQAAPEAFEFATIFFQNVFDPSNF